MKCFTSVTVARDITQPHNQSFFFFHKVNLAYLKVATNIVAGINLYGIGTGFFAASVRSKTLLISTPRVFRSIA